MRPFGIVVAEILGNFLLPQSEISRDAFDTLILDGAVEPLEMGIVVWRPDPGMPMAQSSLKDFLREPFREFGPMIGLDRFEIKRSNILGCLHERRTSLR